MSLTDPFSSHRNALWGHTYLRLSTREIAHTRFSKICHHDIKRPRVMQERVSTGGHSRQAIVILTSHVEQLKSIAAAGDRMSQWCKIAFFSQFLQLWDTLEVMLHPTHLVPTVKMSFKAEFISSFLWNGGVGPGFPQILTSYSETTLPEKQSVTSRIRPYAALNMEAATKNVQETHGSRPPTPQQVH